MKNILGISHLLSCALIFGLNSTQGGEPPGKRKLHATTAGGTIRQVSTTSEARIHVGGRLFASTADYFRGQYDGVPQDLDEYALQPSLDLLLELLDPDDEASALKNLNLTLGTENGITDRNPPGTPAASEVSAWYESDAYAGLTAGLPAHFTAGLTYTIYTSPNSMFGSSHELMPAVVYGGKNLVGKLKPQLELAFPLDEADGLYSELQIAPTLVKFSAVPVTLKLPLTLGIGWDDYYGPGSDLTGFLGAALIGEMPIKAIPANYGEWKLVAEFHTYVLEKGLQQANDSLPGGDDDSPILFARIGLSFFY